MKEETLLELFKKEKHDCCFFETGTSLGKGVRRAINVGFKDVRSMELSPELCIENRERFSNEDVVTIYEGSTRTDLYDACSEIETDIFFWLDAHYSGGWTVMEEGCWCPLIEELEQIKKLSKNTHTICIDDVKDIYNGYMRVNMGDVIKRLIQINPDYKLSFIAGFDEEPDWEMKGTEILMATVR